MGTVMSITALGDEASNNRIHTGVLMPVYEYFCEDCNKEFEVTLTLSEHDHEEKIVCPKCGSHKVHQMAASFTAVTSKKS
jgi:putative FmdB family regulatory protein